MRIRLKHERLGELLAESRMSQNRWALRMGVSRSHLSMLVNGRRALGAGRMRLIRQLLSESVLIAVVGGCLGLPVGWAFKSLVASTIPENELPFWMSFDFDATVVAFSAGLCLLSGLLFGTLPALQMSRADDIDALRDAGHRTAGSRRGRLLSRGLVVGEVTLAMVLLIGSGLLMQGYLYKRTVDLGFDREGVLTIDLELPQEQYSSKTVHFARRPEASHGPSRLWRGHVASGCIWAGYGAMNPC